jgi:hypothetical protein
MSNPDTEGKSNSEICWNLAVEIYPGFGAGNLRIIFLQTASCRNSGKKSPVLGAFGSGNYSRDKVQYT